MERNKFLLNHEVEALKNELYNLLETEPWTHNDVLRISKQLDNLIIEFYNYD